AGIRAALLENLVVGAHEGLAAEEVVDARQPRGEGEMVLRWMEVAGKHHKQPAAPLEDPMTLLQGLLHALHMLEYVERQHGIELAVLEGQRFTGCKVIAGGNAAQSGELGRSLDVFRGDIDTVDEAQAVALEPGDAASAGEAAEVQGHLAAEQRHQIGTEVVIPRVCELRLVLAARGLQHDRLAIGVRPLEEYAVTEDFLKLPDAPLRRGRDDFPHPHEGFGELYAHHDAVTPG